ncbi:phosphatase PAP2 family protein [Aureisphaera galaxeae]|uniref:phosphatase PAP2 family protein n=1 Tax=Aureisphaera galaxeae TaxID=1538023 RepID=UPI0023503E44|nr:phosphatase PAP2 family protein [Aureisphaera galaxeae]MDC8006065.1 phosphatase PAP2 family protein [Aureisphaera galaxeae]
MLETLRQWDRDLLIFLNNLGTSTFDGFWVFVTKIESWTPLFLFFAIILFYYFGKRKGIKAFFWTLITFAITLFLTDGTKLWVERLRPNNVTDLAEQLRVLQFPDTFSFFSGHASTSFAITTFMVLLLRPFTKWIYLAYLWPLLFCTSRIYVGVHYPFDILVGALVGTLLAVLSFRLYKFYIRKDPGSPQSQASS